MVKALLSSLKVDSKLCPRLRLESQAVARLQEALRAGARLPAIAVWKEKGIILDGLHRRAACLKELGEECEIEVVYHSFRNRADAFLFAYAANAQHGERLSPADRVNAIIRAREMKISVERISSALQITAKKATSYIETRTAYDSEGKSVPIRPATLHLAQADLSEEQTQANGSMGGMNMMFYVNRVIAAIENDLLDHKNVKLFVRMKILRDLLDDLLAEAA